MKTKKNQLGCLIILMILASNAGRASAAIRTGTALHGVVQNMEAVSNGMQSALRKDDLDKAGAFSGGLYEGTQAGKDAVAAAVKELEGSQCRNEVLPIEAPFAIMVQPAKVVEPVRIAGMDGPSCVAWGKAEVCVNREVCRIVSACVGGWTAANTAGGGLVWVACLTQVAQEVCSSVPECTSVPVCTQWRN